MFGFGKKKAPPPTEEKRQRTSAEGRTKDDYKNDLAKLGLLGMGVDDFDLDAGSDLDSDPDEADLESELLAMIGEDTAGSSDMLIPSAKLKPATVPVRNDPEAESIFKAPPPPTTVAEALDQRLSKYKSELEKATQANEGSKVRRIGRIVKQYEDAIRDYKKGRAVAFEELPTPPGYGEIPGTQIPAQQPTPQSQPAPSFDSVSLSKSSLPPPLVPEVVKPKIDPFPTPPAVSDSEPIPAPSFDELIPEVHEIDNALLSVLLTRQRQFKEAAVNAKKNGDIELAKEFLRNSKGLETMVQSVQAGFPVDMNTLPSLETASLRVSSLKAQAQAESLAIIEPPPEPESTLPSQGEPAESLFQAPPPPTTIAEALHQRLEKYKSEVEKANETDNSSKARRMGRIVKQYEEAIGAHKKGRPVLFDELPTPPGYGPIPVPGKSVPTSAAPASPNTSGTSPGQGVTAQQARAGSINRGENKPQTKLTLQEKQLRVILARQKKFKEAAFIAKKRGDMDQAKELLRTAKGFDKLVQASEAGLPVDMATLPSSPDEVAALETSDDFEIVASSDCLQPAGSAGDVFSKLEEDLREQLKMCMRTRDHFKSMGDVASGNRFEKLAIETKKDLDTLRLSMKQNGDVPKYHYETRIFSITECNSDLADDEIEIVIIKGINYKVPNSSQVDTFIKVDFPYPSAQEAQTNKTSVIRDTNNPDYEATFKMKIDRTARPFQRFIHRHGVKLEVWSKGGFLRSSTLLGGTTIKLLPLETKCGLHDAFDILEGRRPMGKIEVKVRLREPVLTKQITQKKEKWLAIDRV